MVISKYSRKNYRSQPMTPEISSLFWKVLDQKFDKFTDYDTKQAACFVSYRTKTSIGRRFGNYHPNEPPSFAWYWPKESFLSNASALDVDDHIHEFWFCSWPSENNILKTWTTSKNMDVYPMVPDRCFGSLQHEWMGFIHVVSDTFIQYLRPFGSIPHEWMGFIHVVSDTFIQYLPKDLLGHYHTNEGGSFRWYRTLSSNSCLERTPWVNTTRMKGVQSNGIGHFRQKKF